MSEKIFTTERLKGNPWMGSDIDEDRRMHNLSKRKKPKPRYPGKEMKSSAQKVIKLKQF